MSNRDFEIIGQFNDFKERIDRSYTNDTLALVFFQDWLALTDKVARVIDLADTLKFKGKGEPDDTPGEYDLEADHIANRIFRALDGDTNE